MQSTVSMQNLFPSFKTSCKRSTQRESEGNPQDCQPQNWLLVANPEVGNSEYVHYSGLPTPIIHRNSGYNAPQPTLISTWWSTKPTLPLRRRRIWRRWATYLICKSNTQDILFYHSRLLRLKIVFSYEGGYCGAYLYNAPVSGRVAWEDELSVWSRVWPRRAARAWQSRYQNTFQGSYQTKT